MSRPYKRKPITDKPLIQWFARLLDSGYETRALIFNAEYKLVLLSRMVKRYFKPSRFCHVAEIGGTMDKGSQVFPLPVQGEVVGRDCNRIALRPVRAVQSAFL